MPADPLSTILLTGIFGVVFGVAFGWLMAHSMEDN